MRARTGACSRLDSNQHLSIKSREPSINGPHRAARGSCTRTTRVEAWHAAVTKEPQHDRAGGGNRTRRSRLGEPMCHHNTSPAAVEANPPVEPRRVRRTSRALARCVSRVGIEPTSGRFKKPLQSHRLLPAHGESHPLVSNQNLLGFSQARRPSTPEWEREDAATGVLVVRLLR